MPIRSFTRPSLALLFAILFSLQFSCGNISVRPAAGTNTDASVNDDPTDETAPLLDEEFNVFIFATDYQSSGQLYVATLSENQTHLENSGVPLLGTEATLLYQDDLLYILHAGALYNSVSSDNLQILNPHDTNHPFKTLNQFTTGNGSNPMDVAIKDGTAFISLNNPEADANNVDAAGNPGDVIEMDTSDGSIDYRYSFYDDLNDDGDRHASAYKMLLKDDILYVLLQDLESNTFMANAPGLIGMIDTQNHQVLGVIELDGRNPSSLILSPNGKYLFVSSTADLSAKGAYGGIERVNLKGKKSELFVSDNTLGGYVEKLAANDDTIFAVIGRSNTNGTSFTFESKISTFTGEITDETDIEDFTDFSTDIRAIFPQEDHLWVCYRVISTTEGDSDPVIRVFDTDTAKQIGESLKPLVGGVSIAGE